MNHLLYRDALEEHHTNLDDLEVKLEKVCYLLKGALMQSTIMNMYFFLPCLHQMLRNCNSTIDSGKVYLGFQRY